jgi:F-type H+-transporting ATPase subunit b
VLIDPFTVGAQIVNFLILVWILRRLLYGPITRAMAAREARIREELDHAARLRGEAEAEGARYRELTAGFESERSARLADAREELDAWRREHTRTVRQEVETMRQRWQQALEQEKGAFYLELRRRAGREVFAVARRALHDLADSELEARVIDRFLARLQRLEPGERDQLMAAARADGGVVTVRTAYPLAAADEARLRAGVTAALGESITPRFDRSPDLVSGAELRAGGFKVAWALGDYLESLEDAMAETFGAEPELADG